MRLRICLGVKHTLTNGGKCKGWSPMIPKSALILGVVFAWKLQMFRVLVGKVNKHQIGPHDNIKKVLKRRCFKCHRIVHLDLLCISYDQKKGRKSNWKFDTRPQIPWKQRSMRSNWNVLYTIGNIFSRVIRYCPRTLIKTWFEINMNVQCFGIIRIPILGLPLGSPREKWHLDIITARKGI